MSKKAKKKDTSLEDLLLQTIDDLTETLKLTTDAIMDLLAGVKEPVAKAIIRVTFNRPLTYSEREWLRRAYEEVFDEFQTRVLFVAPDQLFLSDFDSDDSRDLYQGLADYVEARYVNVHPVAVRTFLPEVKV